MYGTLYLSNRMVCTYKILIDTNKTHWNSCKCDSSKYWSRKTAVHCTCTAHEL